MDMEFILIKDNNIDIKKLLRKIELLEFIIKMQLELINFLENRFDNI